MPVQGEESDKFNRVGKTIHKNEPMKKNLGGGTTRLEDHILYYGKDMNTNKSSFPQKGKLTMIGITHPPKHDELSMKRYNKAQARIRTNMLSACYTIIWGQLTLNLQNKIKADPDYAKVEVKKDAPKLYKLVAKLCNKATTSIDHVPTSQVELVVYSILKLSGNKTSLSDYYDTFTEHRRNAKNVVMYFDTLPLKRKLCNDKVEEIGCVHPTGTTEYAIFVGTDHIPHIVDDAYALLLNYKGSKHFIQSQLKKKQSNQESKPDENANSKAKHPGHSVAGKVISHQNVKRLNMYEMELAYGFAHVGYTSIQGEFEPAYIEDMQGNNWCCLNMNHVRGHLNPFWILLDNQSTVHIFFNIMFLVNVQKTNKRLELHTNTGSAIVNTVRELPGVRTVWVHENGIANILLFHKLLDTNNFKIDYTSRPDSRGARNKSFCIETPDRVQQQFQPDRKSNSVFGTRVVNTESPLTVDDNKENFTNRDTQRAKAIRRFQHVTGHPRNKTLIDMATKHIRMVTEIFGLSIYGIEGKRTYQKKDIVDTPLVPLLETIKEYYKNVAIGAGILLLVNKIPILATILRGIHYETPHALLMHLTDVQVNVKVVLMEEHVPEIERFICVIKEKTRAAYAMLPFTCAPRKLVLELIVTIVFYLNAFPWPEGVLQELSLTTLVQGVVLSFEDHFQVIFGEYTQTYECTDNSMKEHTIGAIAAGPSGNVQGGVKFFSLDTGKIIHQTNTDYKLLPMPADVIKRVEHMACKMHNGIFFANQQNDSEVDSNDDGNNGDDDTDYIPPNEHNNIVMHPDVHDLNLDTDEDSNDDPHSHHGMTGVTPPETGTGPEPPNHTTDNHTITGTPTDDVKHDVTGVPTDDVKHDTKVDHTPAAEDGDDVSSDDDIYRTSSSCEVKSTHDPAYVYAYIAARTNPLGTKGHLETVTHIDTNNTWEKIKRVSNNEHQNFVSALEYIENVDSHHNFLMEYTMTQMSIWEELKRDGDQGKASIMKEIHNLVSQDCFEEVNQNTMTSDHRQQALPILMFMLMKRDARLKSRGCADGRPQQL
eukprot:jgi/Psemu1/54022/gm1.54022_g